MNAVDRETPSAKSKMISTGELDEAIFGSGRTSQATPPKHDLGTFAKMGRAKSSDGTDESTRVAVCIRLLEFHGVDIQDFHGVDIQDFHGVDVQDVHGVDI